jgi:peptidoglycan/LPS O-acetylase OafA/YrhL
VRSEYDGAEQVPTSPAAPALYRADIDGLRGIAIGCVVAYHYFPHVVRGGYVGVDVFFLISGYLIADMILQQLRCGTFTAIDFYSRRIRRIFPCLLIVLLAVCAFGWYLLFPGEFRLLIRSVFAGATFFSNFLSWNEAGYFDPAGDTKPLLHLWSLAIEEQFYILLPAWLLLAWRKHWRSLPAIAVVALLSFLLSAIQCNDDPVGAFYSPMSRIWEILCGVILAYQIGANGRMQPHHFWVNSKFEVVSRGILHSPWCRDAISAIGLLGIVVSCNVYSKATAFPGFPALLPVGSTALVIVAGRKALINRWVLSRGPLVGLGLISYSLYMWHWPILVFARIVIGDLILPPQRLELIGLAVILAVATYILVEKPVRRSGSRKAVLALLNGCICIAVGSSLAMALHFQPRPKGAELEEILNAALDWGYPPPAFRMLLVGGHRFWRQDSQVEHTTIFIGDSNVEQYAPRLSELLLKEPAKYRSVVFATTGSCSPIPAFYLQTPGDCRDRMIQAFLLANAPEIDTVVLGALWIRHADVAANQLNFESLEQLIKKLSAKKRVFLILNIPSGPELDPKNMFMGSRLSSVKAVPRTSVQFDLDKFLREYGPLRAELKERAMRAGAVVIDPLDSLCSTNGCPVFDSQGRPLYRDASHMRPFYAIQSALFVDKTIEYQAPMNGR